MHQHVVTGARCISLGWGRFTAHSDVAGDAELGSFTMLGWELSSGVHRATSVPLQFWVFPVVGKEKQLDYCISWHSSSSCFLCYITLFSWFAAALCQCRDPLPTALHAPNAWVSRNTPRVQENLQFCTQLGCNPSGGGLGSASLTFALSFESSCTVKVFCSLHHPMSPNFMGDSRSLQALPKSRTLR